MPYDEREPEPATAPDTENKTKFFGSDSAAGYSGSRRLDGIESFDDHYNRLALLNTGLYTGPWGDNEQLRRNDNLAIFDVLAGQLELTPHQKASGRLAFGTLNLSKLSSPNGIDAALVAIMVCAAVCREDGRMYHPSRSDESNDELFVSVIDDLGYRESVVQSCYATVRDRVVN